MTDEQRKQLIFRENLRQAIETAIKPDTEDGNDEPIYNFHPPQCSLCGEDLDWVLNGWECGSCSIWWDVDGTGAKYND